ncbi:quercetin dioxygenase-like cupin family protein [Deinococcus metalli]|uniref:Quercetin dioxygenase-like cupin family protein n=1 Tax=Deinococcus metalli TaxID=1141878 RepID=A0A7W8KE58_9DEIO|nr:quercetin 2,3-dioxygenase [Deinococcus metalli]MBB5376539.1 quercetin dioxygenase-like cupin family protein [Deinococcus metalli]GHF43260.1 hypothetical protein GCM10017781_19620 [Deinococcus metalli]
MTLPYIRRAAPDTTHLYLGQPQTVLARTLDTGGAFAVVEEVMRAGLEPPLHTHTREDEAFYVLDGQLDFQIGNEHRRATPGDFVYLPRGMPHAFKVVTPTARMLVLLTPGGFEAFFGAMATPLQDDPLLPTPADFQRLVSEAPAYGIQWAMPATADQAPQGSMFPEGAS